MKNFFLILLLILFSGFTSISYAAGSGTINFDSSTYDGEYKKSGGITKAHGVGIVTFTDGSIYEGKFKSNRIHGKGKYTDSNGNVFEGKWYKGKLKSKLDKKTRQIIILNLDTGVQFNFQIKGTGKVKTKWFDAKKTSSGTYELTAKGKRDMEKAIKASEVERGGSDGGGSGGGCG